VLSLSFVCLVSTTRIVYLISFLLTIIMSKRKLFPGSLSFSKEKPSTMSSVEKSVNQVLLTSRDTVHFQDGILSSMFAISSALGSISKEQKVLLDKIESIALRLEITSRVVHSMREEFARIRTNYPESSSVLSEEEIREFLNSPKATPIFGSIMDLTCSETPWPSSPQRIDLTSQSPGSGDRQE